MKQIFWLTGLPCSGKTTIANALSKKISAVVLDGDDIRSIEKNNDFTISGRKKHMMSVGAKAYEISKNKNVIVALVSPIKSVREALKKIYPNLVEIFVYCDPKICEKRDVKGMWAKARKGLIKNFTGVSSPYEEPRTERLADHSHTTFVDTEMQSVDECVETIIKRHYKPYECSLLLGRYQCIPPHKGHQSLVKTLLGEGKNVLIGIRDIDLKDEKNPYSSQEIKESFDDIYKDDDRVQTIILPNIVEIAHGRSPAWKIREIVLDEETQKISATSIRNKK